MGAGPRNEHHRIFAGLVAITAPSGFVAACAVLLIGTEAGVLVVESIRFLEHRLRIDGPGGAISVHGTCWMWRALSLGLFADGDQSRIWGGGRNSEGVFYGDACGLPARATERSPSSCERVTSAGSS